MAIDYEKIRKQNIKDYGTKVNIIGQRFANLYSDRTHFIYELIQNAEDAMRYHLKSPETGWVKFHLFNDRLEVRHNGRPFNYEDVRGICGLVDSNKSKDLNQIGKFGHGFQSVYAYTSAPEVYSGDETFYIEDYVLPYKLKNEKANDNVTLFVLPFDNPKEAFHDISKRLRELDTKTLLFLDFVGDISWSIQEEESGRYQKHITESMSPGQYPREVSIISRVNNKTTAYEYWLVFSRYIEMNHTSSSDLKVEVAFQVLKNGEEKKVIPVSNSQLMVFFPTEKETHLKFLIQGPYEPTPSRDNIKNNEHNKKLIRETAILVADCIEKIREVSLLNVDFLNVLPISAEDLPQTNLFRPIFDAVLKKFKSDEFLLPADDGTYINSSQALLAGSEKLTKLLDSGQLSLLFGKQDRNWITSKITRNSDKTRDLWRYLRYKIGISEFSVSDFADRLTADFMIKQSDEWIIKLYIFLKDQISYGKRGYYLRYPWRNIPFIRLESDSHVTPFNDKGEAKVYLPSSKPGTYTPKDKIVKQTIADDEGAREFLDLLGLKEFDATAEIWEEIQRIYFKSEVTVTRDTREKNIEHIKRIAQSLQSNSLTDTQKQKFKEAPFLLSVNNATAESTYKKPSEIYIPKVFKESCLEKFFDKNPNIWFLDAFYLDIPEIKFLIDELNISDKPKIKTSDFKINRRYKRGLKKDYEIEGLEFFLENNKPSVEMSSYLWELLLLSQIESSYEIKFKGTFKYANDKNFIGSAADEEPRETAVYKLLTSYPWLLDKQGEFKKTSEILLSDLPDDFDTDSPEAKALEEKLEFKKDILQQLIEILPHEEQRETFNKIYTCSPEKLSAINQYIDQLLKQDQFPRHQVLNKERRERTAREIHDSSPEKKYKKRLRSVRISKNTIDEKTSLREWYRREEGRVICQICKTLSSFQTRDGKYYFEAVGFLKNEKEFEPNNLALCPLCSAKFQYGERTDDAEIKKKLLNLFDNYDNDSKDSGKLTITITLCGQEVEIQFDARHLIDFSPILNES